jgi:MFS family permease
MAIFMWVYALCSPLGGFVADRLNRRWTIIGSLLVWSAVTWLTGHARTYSQMLTFRGLMGISEAFYIPAGLALIADFHPTGTRARAIGIHQTGLYAGLALGGVGGYIADSSSWRHCFTWFGAAGVAYALVLIFFLRDAKRHRDTGLRPVSASMENQSALSVNTLLTGQRPVSQLASLRIGQTFLALWSLPAFWILSTCFTLPAIAGWVTKNWLPTFLADRFHLTQGPAGLSATGYIQFASLGGVFLGGVIADRWMQKTDLGRIYTSAIGMAMLVPALLLLGYAWALPAAIAAMICFGIGWGFFDCNNMPILCQIAPPQFRATGYGFMNLISISIGAAATVGLGWMRDHGISFSIAFVISAAVAMVSAGLILLIKPQRADWEEL